MVDRGRPEQGSGPAADKRTGQSDHLTPIVSQGRWRCARRRSVVNVESTSGRTRARRAGSGSGSVAATRILDPNRSDELELSGYGGTNKNPTSLLGAPGSHHEWRNASAVAASVLFTLPQGKHKKNTPDRHMHHCPAQLHLVLHPFSRHGDIRRTRLAGPQRHKGQGTSPTRPARLGRPLGVCTGRAGGG